MEGQPVGWLDGSWDGNPLGCPVGYFVGSGVMVGLEEGLVDGCMEGNPVGCPVGKAGSRVRVGLTLG
jgi:hypothetical protein